MENFFVRYARDDKLTYKKELYDGAWIEGRTLYDGNTQIALPFEASHMKNLLYDYVIIDSERMMYRLNKCRLVPTEVGAIHSDVLGIYPSPEHILIVTLEDILLFNPYFELIKSKPLQNLSETAADIEWCKGVWADDLFCLITHGRMCIYDTSLEIVSDIAIDVKDAVFISKYNILACACDGMIKFIEPNGLEHGDPIEISCDTLELMVIDDFELLVAYDGSKITILYMKNFHWYKKCVLYEKLVEIRNNTVVVESSSGVRALYVYRELSPYFVIDGSCLNYTNISKMLIPPPYYYKQLAFESQVDTFYHRDDKLVVLSGNKIILYSIENDIFERLVEFDLKSHGITLGACVELLLINGLVYLRDGDLIYTISKDCVKKYTEEVVHQGILRIYNVDDKLWYLSATGKVFGVVGSYRFTHKFPFKLSAQFNFCWLTYEYNKKLDKIPFFSFLLNNKTLYVYGEEDTPITLEIPIVSSVIVHCGYFIYVTRDQLITRNIWDSFGTAYADKSLDLLAVVGNRIVCQTAFGSLETTTSKVFSKATANELILAGKHKEAADLCDKNFIGYEIFYKDGKCSVDLLNVFTDKQAQSLISILGIRNKVYLENDSLHRLKNLFDPSLVYDNAILDKKDAYLSNSCVSHLFSTEYHQPLFEMPVVGNAVENAAGNVAGNAIANVVENTSAEIDLNNPVESMALVLSKIDSKSKLHTAISLFLMAKRMDLCFYLPDLERVVKILLTQMSSNEIITAAISTHSLDKIVLAHRICQTDCVSFVDFYKSRKHVAYALSDYIEDRVHALYYLARDASTEEDYQNVLQYATKHGIVDDLLMFQHYGIFSINFYVMIAPTVEPRHSFILYAKGNAHEDAHRIAEEHLLWRDALEYYKDSKTQRKFAELLISNDRYEETGEICEKYLDEPEQAIRHYITGSSFGKALDVYKKGLLHLQDLVLESSARTTSGNELPVNGLRVLFIEKSQEALKKELMEFKEHIATYEKYRERLKRVRSRLNDNLAMTQTTFSYTSTKTARNALLKDRPGGVFENEYVLNKLRGAVLVIGAWRDRVEGLLRVFREFGLVHCIEVFNNTFLETRTLLKSEVNEIWGYHRVDFDTNTPVIPKPILSDHFY